jgi:glycerophosphoryl diester phosphodiesterase
MKPMRFAPPWLTAGPITHRGLHDWRQGVVENTLGACAASCEAGYAIECDLQITADGEAVLFHDDTLERVTEAQGPVKERTLAELEDIKIRHTKERIPALSQLLALVAGKVPLVIELKPQWDGDLSLAARTVEVLKNYGGPHCVMSFDPDVIEAVRRFSPGTVRGMISDRALDPYYNRLPPAFRHELRTLGYLERTRPHFLSMDVHALPWAPVKALRGQGMPVITWTIRSAEQAEDALRYCDQITFEGFRP